MCPGEKSFVRVAVSGSGTKAAEYQLAMTRDTDPLERIYALMRTARKHMLVLMAAVHDGNDELIRDAAARVRGAVRGGEHAAVRLKTHVERRAAVGMIETTRLYTKPWLERARSGGSMSRSDIGAAANETAQRREDDEQVTDIDLNGARLFELDLSMLDLRGMRARGAVLERMQASGSHLSWCELGGSTLVGSRFDDTTIEHSNFDRANLERTSWVSARVSRSSFAGAVLVDARMEDIVLTDCDLRGVDMGVVNGTLRDGPVRAVFDRCDLRDTNWSQHSVAGSYFNECRLHGAHGTPFGQDDVAIIRPDLSVSGDRSAVGDINDVRALWRS